MWTRMQLKANGKQMFCKNYWECVAVSLIMGFFSTIPNYNSTRLNLKTYGDGLSEFNDIYMSSSEIRKGFVAALAISTMLGLFLMVAGALLKIFVGNVLEVGGNRFFIENRTRKAGLKTLLVPFRSGHYGNVALTMFLMNLYISLWTMLFVIPGIIKTYEYLMVPYIIAENPEMDRREAFAISKRMMDGEKWNAFVLTLSFLGWLMLDLLTCGILGLLFVTPYIHATYAELYTYNKIKAYNEGYIR